MIDRMAIAGRSRLLPLAAVVVLLAGSYVALFGLPPAEAQPAGYTGCVNPATGYFRVLLYSATCGPAEIPISFGATGPPGPEGPPGPQGPPGTILSVAQFQNTMQNGFSEGNHPLGFLPGPSFGSGISQPGGGTFQFDDPGIYRVDFVLMGSFGHVEGVQIEVDNVPVGAPFRAVGDQDDDLTQLVGSRLVEVSAGSRMQLIMTVAAGQGATLLADQILIITQLTSTAL